VIIETARLRLRCWRNADRSAFAAMNAHPEVMRDLGGPISREKSDAKLDRYAAAFEQYGFGRMVIETRAGDFLGYTGVMPIRSQHPMGAHDEIGWRLVRDAWGRGYVTEAAGAALEDAFRRARLSQVVAYTAPDNVRSQAVMARLGLRRDASRDFTAVHDGLGAWRGLVWAADADWKASPSVTKGG
jgi:RimJ/RimL family protein N-acetyltransferase